MRILPRKHGEASVVEPPKIFLDVDLLMITDRLPRWMAYAFAALITVFMLYLRMKMAVSIGQRPLLILFVTPIILSSMLGGFGPGLIATAIASLGVNYFGIPPLNSFRIKESHDLFQWLMLIVSGVLCSYLSELLHRARRQADERRLQQQVFEKELRESADKYRLLFETANDAIIIYNFGSQIMEVNPMAVHQLGYAHDELLSMTVNQIVPPEEIGQVQERIDILKKDGRLTFESKRQNKNGSRIPMDISAWRIDWEGQPVIMTIGRDISKRKQAERALHLANNYNRSLIEASLDPLVTIGVDGKITDVNQATELATARRRDALIGTDFADYFTEPELARAGYLRVFQEGQISDYALNIKRPDGSEIPVLYNATVYRDINGVIIGVFAAARDITERNRVEKARLDIELKLHQMRKAESLGRMAGAIAHHFNNQLYVVMGNIEMAIDGLPDDSDRFRHLTEAMKASTKAAQISSLMLTYLGQTPGKLEMLDLSESCRQYLSLIQAPLPDGITFNTELPAAGPFIRSNAGQIQKILSNLLTNASEAIGEYSGTITLTVRTVALENIPAAMRFPVDWQPKESIYACLEVADSGCGIGDTDIEKIFDPFFTTKFTGRGLGLSTVIGMVTAQNGGITVETKEGGGSVFRVYLPVSGEAVPASPQKAAELTELKGTGTILVVDDDPLVRNMAKLMLTRLGYNVLEAKDGVEAVEVFQQDHPSIRCVLSDLTMPRMNGWETLEAIRKLAPGIPVVLSSGYDEAQVMAEDHPERPNAFLGKPYQIKGLGEIISRVLTAVDR
jgi:PAS domain S-box-containing protein